MGSPERPHLSVVSNEKGHTVQVNLDPRKFSISALMNILRLQIEYAPSNGSREVFVREKYGGMYLNPKSLKDLHGLFRKDEEARQRFFDYAEGHLKEADQIII